MINGIITKFRRLWVTACRLRIVGYFIKRCSSFFNWCVKTSWVFILLLIFWRFKTAIIDHNIEAGGVLSHRVRLLQLLDRGWPIVIVDEELVLNNWRFTVVLNALWS